MKCSDCKFWEKASEFDGECRIDPPVIVPGIFESYTGEPDFRGHWPITMNDGHCGRHNKVERRFRTLTQDEISKRIQNIEKQFGVIGEMSDRPATIKTNQPG